MVDTTEPADLGSALSELITAPAIGDLHLLFWPTEGGLRLNRQPAMALSLHEEGNTNVACQMINNNACSNLSGQRTIIMIIVEFWLGGRQISVEDVRER